MESVALNIPVTEIARSIWEMNKPGLWIAGRIGVGERYLRALLANEKQSVPVHIANQVSSCAQAFTLPVTSDQPPIVVMSRKLICMASSHEEVLQQTRLLEAELETARARQDVKLQFLIHWQLNFAHHRAAAFLDPNKGRERLDHISLAVEHAERMSALLPKTNFKDPALMRVVERRNWATTKFVKASADGNFPSEVELRHYYKAYNEAEAEIKKTHLDVEESRENREAMLADMRLPMHRALCLDRVEIAAYLNETDLVVKSIAKLREVGDSRSARAFLLALDSMPAKAKDALWTYKEWKQLMGELNQKFAKRADNYAKE